MNKRGPQGAWRPNWREPSQYHPLLRLDRRAFAWEWLRRTRDYRLAWENRDQSQIVPANFGLLAYEDPDKPAPNARPIWSSETDPHVLDSQCLLGLEVSRTDLLDIRDLANYVSVEVDGQDEEHWLISDGQWGIRIDLHSGTLLGGPLLLDHQFSGLASARPRLEALAQLVELCLSGELRKSMTREERRAERWVLELRTADAIAEEATQQDIARTLFGRAIDDHHWRAANSSYRLRVQRLVKAARKRLAHPLDPKWFK